MTNPDDLSLPELWGMRISVSESLPTVNVPDRLENIRREIRHANPGPYEYVGLPIGPKPGEVTYTHQYIMGDTLFISKEAYDILATKIRELNKHGKWN